MEGKQKCEIGGCDKPAQIAINVKDKTVIYCCRNHASDVIGRVQKNGIPYKVEPIPPEP